MLTWENYPHKISMWVIFPHNKYSKNFQEFVMSKQKFFPSKMESSHIEIKGGVMGLMMLKGGRPQDMGLSHDDQSYAFTFSTDLSTVETMTRTHTATASDTKSAIISSTTTQTLNIADSTFKTVTGLNDKNAQSVLDVIQTNSNDYFVSTRIYNDKDGDGKYTENLDIQVATGTKNLGLKQQKFTFNDDGTVIADNSITGMGHNHTAFVEQNAVFKKVTLGDISYVTETVADVDGTGYHFAVFRDDNADGTWTQIAQGETLNGVDTTTTAVDLVGIQSYLTSSIVG